MKSLGKLLSIFLGGSITTAGSIVTGIFVTTYETLENKYKNLILAQNVNEERWTTLKRKLEKAKEENLSSYFKLIEKSPGNTELKKLCEDATNIIYKSAFHENSDFEKNVSNYCILKINEVITSPIISEENKYSTKVADIEKIEDRSADISPYLRILKGKLKALNNASSKQKRVKKWCENSLKMTYVNASSEKLIQDINKYCLQKNT